jgi:sulfotransferase
MKNLYFISGLPRAGSTMLANILKQNPKIHGEAVSSLSAVVGGIQANWNTFEQNKEYPNDQALLGVLKGVISGYYSHIDKPIIFDKDRNWLPMIAMLEAIMETQIKMIICVRNPAEIVTSFERLRQNNPLYNSRSDQYLKDQSNIATRAYYIAGPEGPLGMSHRHLKDAVTMGYLDRLLFVDYNRFCNTPKSQTKRIYDFFELPEYTHDFDNIDQVEQYNDTAIGFKDLHKVKRSIQKTTVNCVQYIGLELYEQYNSEIFWNAWI